MDKYVIAWFGPQADDISTSLTLKENLKIVDLTKIRDEGASTCNDR